MDRTKGLDLAAVLRAQAGHVTKDQLLEIGFARSTIHRHAQCGLLVPVGRRTFRDPARPASREGEVMAACLEHRAVASHRTGTWLHNLWPWPGVIDLSVLDGRSRTRYLPSIGTTPVILHSSTNLPSEDRLTVRSIPVTSVARSLFGLAALVPRDLSQKAVSDAMAQATDDRLATDSWLWWLLERRRCRGRNGVKVLEDILAERAELGPTESWLERQLVDLIDGAGLDRPVTQRVIRRSGRFAARVDFLYEPERIVIEALGYKFHRTPDQTAADTARANELQLLGHLVLQFTTRHIVEQPGFVLRTISRALEQRWAERGRAS